HILGCRPSTRSGLRRACLFPQDAADDPADPAREGPEKVIPCAELTGLYGFIAIRMSDNAKSSPPTVTPASNPPRVAPTKPPRTGCLFANIACIASPSLPPEVKKQQGTCRITAVLQFHRSCLTATIASKADLQMSDKTARGDGRTFLLAVVESIRIAQAEGFGGQRLLQRVVANPV